MEILKHRQQTDYNLPDLLLLERGRLLVLDLQEFRETESLYKLHDNTQTLVFHEGLVVGDDVWMLQLLVDFDLLHGVPCGVLAIV